MKRSPSRLAELLNPAAVLLPAANVIMQLSAPPVGYGVLESPLADRIIPRQLWLLGYQTYLWDMRSRARRGRRIV